MDKRDQDVVGGVASFLLTHLLGGLAPAPGEHAVWLVVSASRTKLAGGGVKYSMWRQNCRWSWGFHIMLRIGEWTLLSTIDLTHVTWNMETDTADHVTKQSRDKPTLILCIMMRVGMLDLSFMWFQRSRVLQLCDEISYEMTGYLFVRSLARLEVQWKRIIFVRCECARRMLRYRFHHPWTKWPSQEMDSRFLWCYLSLVLDMTPVGLNLETSYFSV